MADPPKRVLAQIRELEQAGYGVYNQKGSQRMSSEVKEVTGVIQDVAAVKEKARKISASLRQNITEVNKHLDAAEELADALGEAGSELGGLLNTHTNRPPTTGEKG